MVDYTTQQIPHSPYGFDIDEEGYLYTTMEGIAANENFLVKMDGEFHIVACSADNAYLQDANGDINGCSYVAASKNPNYPLVYYGEAWSLGGGIWISTRRINQDGIWHNVFQNPLMPGLSPANYVTPPEGSTQTCHVKQMSIDNHRGGVWAVFSESQYTYLGTQIGFIYGLSGASEYKDISDDICRAEYITFGPVTNQVRVGTTIGMDSLGDYQGLCFYDASDMSLNGRLLSDCCGAYSYSAH